MHLQRKLFSFTLILILASSAGAKSSVEALNHPDKYKNPEVVVSFDDDEVPFLEIVDSNGALKIKISRTARKAQLPSETHNHKTESDSENGVFTFGAEAK